MAAPYGANTTNVQVLFDGGDTTIIKVTGFYLGGAQNSNTTIIQANTLQYANNSQPCVVCVEDIKYMVSLPSENAYAELYYANANTSANVVIYNFGSYSGSGEYLQFIPNPLVPQTLSGGGPGKSIANTANLINNTAGDIGLFLYQVGTTVDAFTFVITVRKIYGYANAWLQYNDSSQNNGQWG